tara:strand:- start:92 stop:388 length:297 start_codon:yes stop_codon:yes gene_type:complete
MALGDGYSVPEHDDDVQADRAQQTMFREVVSDKTAQAYKLGEIIDESYPTLGNILEYWEIHSKATYKLALLEMLLLVQDTDIEEDIVEPLVQKRMEGK